MVGVSVCHHIRVGIKRRKAALLELCGLLQERVAGKTTTLLLEEEEGFIFSGHEKSSFSGKVKDLERSSLSFTVVLNGMLAQHTCQSQLLLSYQCCYCAADR
jgi:hypothetical protein